MLQAALESVLDQTTAAIEIIVGDDSDDCTSNKAVIKAVRKQAKSPTIRHMTNRAGSQASNVHRLMMNSQGEWICLLHDDDLLLPSALSVLMRAIKRYEFRHGVTPVLAYGMQLVIDHFGVEDPMLTMQLNRKYLRSSDTMHQVMNDSFMAAMYQQAPNDGYLVNRQLAIQIGYDNEFRDSCDFAFAAFLSKVGNFCFIPEYTMKYRMTSDSVQRGVGTSNDRSSIEAFYLTKSLMLDKSEYPQQLNVIQYQRVKSAVIQAIRVGELTTSISLFLSREHMRSVTSLGYYYRIVLLLTMIVKKTSTFWRYG